ncbi:hypothetical protein [Alteripontixanthobacter maritimus]|nr:hypothetical protein [Alteripontixanthobacter maritimus]
MERRSILKAVLAAALLPATIACADNTALDYRYRLTVEVDTPEGLRTGSSVIEVQQKLVRPGSSPGSQAINRSIYGEAVTVDLPNGGTLFALLRSEDQIGWAGIVMQDAAPKVAGESYTDRFDNMLLIDGEVTLPRRWPLIEPDIRLSGYPMMVTFANSSIPTTVKLVDPDDLAGTFGNGVHLRRVTVQITEDPVTHNIVENYLPWLPDYYSTMLDGNRINTISADNRLANDLSQGDFIMGNSR